MTSKNCPRSVGRLRSTGLSSVLARRSSPGMTFSSGACSRFEMSSANFTVRVICGSIARTGSSTSFSRRLTRSPSR